MVGSELGLVVPEIEASPAAGYYGALAAIFFLEALGMVLAIAIWLRPVLVYWPFMLALLAVYAAPMVWLFGRDIDRRLRRATALACDLRTHSRVWEVWPAALVSALLFGILGLGIALTSSKFLGVTSVQLMVMSVVALDGARRVRNQERSVGLPVLMEHGNFPPDPHFLLQRR